MEKIAIITDSTCGLPKEYVEKFNVKVANLKIVYEKNEYIDGVTITPEEVYSKLDIELPTTSMPSVHDVCELYDELIKEGYTHVIALPVSSGLSGTINSFRLAAEQYEDRIVSNVYDSKMLSMAIGMPLIEIGESILNGKTYNEVCVQLENLVENTELYFTVDTLEYLIKGGRIGKVSGSIGKMLNLKPIITMDEDGRYTTLTKVRGSKQAINKLIDTVNEKLDGEKGKVVVMTGTMTEEADKMVSKFKVNPNVTKVYSGIITPAVGIHSGPRILAVAVMIER